MEYDVTISANIRSKDGISHFTIFQTHMVELSTFAELDALILRMREAVQPEKGE